MHDDTRSPDELEITRLAEDLEASEAARHRVESARAAIEASFRALAEAFPAAVFRADTTGTISYANRRWGQMAPGVTRLVDLEPKRGPLAEQLHAIAAGEATGLQVDIHRADRSVVRVTASVVPEDPGTLIGQLTDAADQADLREEAELDDLTQVANGATFDRALEEALRSDREDLAMLLLDLDGIGTVNDEHGREAGDQVIKAIAQRLTHTLRPGDLVARYHKGDQFALLCRGVQPGNENIITARIDDMLADPVSWPGGWWQPSASVGVVRGAEAQSAPELVEAVEASMRRAKAGRVMAPTLDSLRDLSNARRRDDGG